MVHCGVVEGYRSLGRIAGPPSSSRDAEQPDTFPVRARTYAEDMTTRQTVTLFLCGDVMTGRGVDQIFPSSCPPGLREPFVTSALDYVRMAQRTGKSIPIPVDHAYVWGDALSVLEDVRPDQRVANLETSVTLSEDAFPKGINYRMHPANATVLTTAKLDCCSLANNHVLDWAEVGLLDTLAALEREGIRRREQEGTSKPPDKPGVHLLSDLSRGTIGGLADRVEKVKRPGGLAVASIHWGANWGYDVPRRHRRFTHDLIDHAFFDVVHGHSAHRAKAVEVYEGHLILYGCGDFLTDYEGIGGHTEFRPDLALMYFPTLDRKTGRLVDLELFPLRIRGFRLNHVSAADREWLRARLNRKAERLGHRVDPREGRLRVEW